MKNKIALVTFAAFILLIQLACQKSNEESSQPEPTIHTLAINCENRDANLVPGLPATMGQAPSNPTNVEAGIQKYKELMSSDPSNAQFYTKQVELMSQKLNEFNTQFKNSCSQ